VKALHVDAERVLRKLVNSNQMARRVAIQGLMRLFQGYTQFFRDGLAQFETWTSGASFAELVDCVKAC
jgi:hypothetical protein